MGSAAEREPTDSMLSPKTKGMVHAAIGQRQKTSVSV